MKRRVDTLGAEVGAPPLPPAPERGGASAVAAGARASGPDDRAEAREAKKRKREVDECHNVEAEEGQTRRLRKPRGVSPLRVNRGVTAVTPGREHLHGSTRGHPSHITDDGYDGSTDGGVGGGGDDDYDYGGGDEYGGGDGDTAGVAATDGEMDEHFGVDLQSMQRRVDALAVQLSWTPLKVPTEKDNDVSSTKRSTVEVKEQRLQAMIGECVKPAPFLTLFILMLL